MTGPAGWPGSGTACSGCCRGSGRDPAPLPGCRGLSHPPVTGYSGRTTPHGGLTALRRTVVRPVHHQAPGARGDRHSDLRPGSAAQDRRTGGPGVARPPPHGDRKSTRLNSSHVKISYAVFCLKKKKKKKIKKITRKNKNKLKTIK